MIVLNCIFGKLSDKEWRIFHKNIKLNATFGCENKVTWRKAGAHLEK